MPCTDGGVSYTHYADNPETKKRLDRVTRLLCGLCKRIEAQGHGGDDLITVDQELVEWWENHKILDAKKEQARLNKLREAKQKEQDEKERQKLIANLTIRERQLLNIKD